VALAMLPPDATVLVAFSGGLDSTALLAAAALCRSPATVLAWHVNHGLQSLAQGWSEHCEAMAATLGTGFGLTRLAGSPAGSGEGLEEWARRERYAALRAAAQNAGAAAVLTAHHADDQVETVLMRLGRGTGLQGATGMASHSWLGPVQLLRPFLQLSRDEIAAWAANRGLRWVEDPSNADPRRLRNAIRHEVLPVLERTMPAFRRNLLRSASNLRVSAESLAELTARDLSEVALRDAPLGQCLSRRRWLALPPPRRAEVLRAWLATHGCRSPSSARLAEIARQIADASAGSSVALAHDRCCLRIYRDLVVLDRLVALNPLDSLGPLDSLDSPGPLDSLTRLDRFDTPDRLGPPDSLAVGGPHTQGIGAAGADYRFRWAGEVLVHAPGGGLRIDPVTIQGEFGLPAALLRDSELSLGQRRGGERLRVVAGGPARSLKNLFQERGVPPWIRQRLPVLRADAQVLWVAGLGANAQFLVDQGERVALGWRPADPGSARPAYGAQESIPIDFDPSRVVNAPR
jgi:tRNA(Ile)-lysidine synthase